MKKQIKLMVDYNCWPLWEYEDKDLVDNLHPSELSLSSEIKERLLNWQNIYDGIMNWDDPASSDFASEAEKMAFEKEGINLWQVLQKELGNEYEVVYFSGIKCRVLSSVDEPVSLVRPHFWGVKNHA